MGRPLKIKKYAPAPGQGGVNYQPGAAVYVDIGFNSWNQLTNPVYPVTMTPSNFVGVVGGANAIGGNTIASAAYPVVKCIAWVPGDSTYRNSFIIRQKGTTKYLVAAINPIADDNLVAGRTYVINTVGTTNWAAFGARPNAAAGDVFTCSRAGFNSGNGNAFLVGVCVLANDPTPASGFMSITMNVGGDSTEIGISKLTNHWALDYSTPPVRYAINFFTDEGTEIKSGTRNQANSAGQQNIVDLGQIDQYTS